MIVGAHRYPRQDAVIYGRPAAEAVVEAAERLGAKRLLITTTKSLSGEGGLASRLAQALGARCVGVYAEVSAHSPREGVIAGAARARDAGADLLVAVGGGSVIDATKVMQLALWAGLERPEQLDAYRAGRGPDRADAAALTPGVRMVAVPTTLSAAEFTPFAGVTDTARRAKEGYTHPELAPKVVVLDPGATVSTPETLWLSTGMKAVDHAVEQLCGSTRAPFADSLAVDGLQQLARGLPASRRDPADLDARQECQFGMWLAISGLAATGASGASHAIGHTLGGSYGVPHGITSCITLPAVLRWNAEAGTERQAIVSTLMGRPGVPAAEAVGELVQSLGLPRRLSEVGVGRDAFPATAEHTMHDNGVRTNPRPIHGPEDIVQILELAA